LHIGLTPLRTILISIERGIISFLTGRLPQTEEDIHVIMKSALNMGFQKGIVHPSELSVFESFFNFREKTAGEIMTPRTRVQAFDISTKIEEIIAFTREHKKEKAYPIFKKDIDHIIGYINVQDILSYCFRFKEKLKINDILRPAHAVPQSKNLLDLMQEMLQSDKKIAVVIDEYGGTAGVITFELLIEDFLNFFYTVTEPDWIKVSKDVYTLPGRLRVDKLAKLLHLEFETESKTLSGLLIERLGEIPEIGTRIEVDDHLFIVKKVSKKSIQEVTVKKK
jgi:putative hemolysin